MGASIFRGDGSLRALDLWIPLWEEGFSGCFHPHVTGLCRVLHWAGPECALVQFSGHRLGNQRRQRGTVPLAQS